MNLKVGILFLAAVCSGLGLPRVTAEETRGNLVRNGGFENGMQFWDGDGQIATFQAQNQKVCEIEASKSRLKEVSQDFDLNGRKQLQIVFRARSVNYQGAGLRISVHVKGGGSILWTKKLPDDGSWVDGKLDYVPTSLARDEREVVFAAHLGTGSIQIDDVEVREPTTVAPVVASAAPSATTSTPPNTPNPGPAPVAPAVAQGAATKAVQVAAAGSFPAEQEASAKQLMGYRWDWRASGGNYQGKTLFERNGDALEAGNGAVHGDWRISADGTLTYRRGNDKTLVWVLKRVSPERFEGEGVAGAALGRTCSLTQGPPR